MYLNIASHGGSASGSELIPQYILLLGPIHLQQHSCVYSTDTDTNTDICADNKYIHAYLK